MIELSVVEETFKQIKQKNCRTQNYTRKKRRRNRTSFPAKLKPGLSGRWRWQDVKTLLFEADTRFRGSTKYQVVVPKGTSSLLNGVLAEDYWFSFTTPLVQILGKTHSASVLSLDGRRNASLLCLIQSTNRTRGINSSDHFAKRTLWSNAVGGVFPVRLATPEEISADPIIHESVQRCQFLGEHFPNRRKI